MKQKYLRIKITGGLGNQLFKFFSAYRIARESKRKLIIDTTWYKYSNISGGLVNNRDYQLNQFKEINSIECVESRNWRLHKIHGQLMRKLPKETRESAGYFMDDLNSKFLSNRKSITLDGSFEDVRLLPSNQEILRIWHSLNIENDEYRKYLEQIITIKPLIIHVRLTDYLNFGHLYDVLTREYYLQGIRNSEIYSGQRPIWLFSDNPPQAETWLNLGDKISKVFPENTKLNPLQIMNLMSNAGDLIIAHSTFSWWAAYIGTLYGQISNVYMPSRFFRNQMVSINLRAFDWKVINV